MLEERTVTGKIEILEDGQMQVRTDTVVLRDGVEIARTYHRHVLAPGEDVSTRDAKSQAVSAVVWTPQVVQAYKDKAAAQQALTDRDKVKADVLASSVPESL